MPPPPTPKPIVRPPAPALDGTGLIALDSWLGPYADALRARYSRYTTLRDKLIRTDGSLVNFASGHLKFGLNPGVENGKSGVWCREWAPGAHAVSLIGDFNQWNAGATPLTRDDFGVWSAFIPDNRAGGGIQHAQRVKLRIRSALGEQDRIPAYIRRVSFEKDGSNAAGQYWNPPHAYQFKHSKPKAHGSAGAGLRIYESHVGMAAEEERVGTFDEFRTKMLPRIAKAGYNAVQLMAIQEHPYYGSFGYHVSNFFAVSSRFGTPEEFKALVDDAHALGLRVLLDIVHSHSVKNTVEGLNLLDGTDYQYFHAGPKGMHPAWDSMLFDYSKWEVLRFLLSNVRFWLEEYNLDGFRFDGVTSMFYHHHGLGHGFSSYDDYFGPAVDDDAVTYLQLANQLAYAVRPGVVNVAEDVSGMAGLARPVDEGGVGFDYRLAMGIPDFWIKLLKERRDEDWNMNELVHTLMNRRVGERHVGYAESHDQALVGDKTLAFWLMDAEMYWNMNKGSRSLVIDRGIALHKLMRLVTFALGGEGYLNFMGNEFGHPEWIDFPREGNGYSYKYARRQWSLADNAALRYSDLLAFDRAMMSLDERFGVLADCGIDKLDIDDSRKCIMVARGSLVFLLNFHPTQSYTDLRVGVPRAENYQIILDTDAKELGGHGLVLPKHVYPLQRTPQCGKLQSLQVYLPSRTAQVLAPASIATS